MLSTFLGFCTFAIMSLHVVGAYANAIKAGNGGDRAAIDSHHINVAAQAMLSVFWLLATARLLGW